ncbi:hypothetical protein [Teredinibacter purpureus]|uniref:hypothetical protein n=1 Tax=Teredinibacter purpureus TaxID=2731756 RepID=UPI0005F80AC1|nr:hypothetical protein [Teredinibacter purpureus]
MEMSEALSLGIGVIGTAIAIYQAAVIRENKKRKREIQYLLAGVNNAALQKQISWQNRISTLPKLETDKDWELGNTLMRARDDCQEIASLTVALEGAIDVDYSAIKAMMQKFIDTTKQNNELQAEGLKNPTLKHNRESSEEKH